MSFPRKSVEFYPNGLQIAIIFTLQAIILRFRSNKKWTVTKIGSANECQNTLRARCTKWVCRYTSAYNLTAQISSTLVKCTLNPKSPWNIVPAKNKNNFRNDVHQPLYDVRLLQDPT